MNDSTNNRVPMYAHYTPEGIWSTGRTPEEAIERFLDEARATREEAEEAQGGPLLTALMTRRLAEYIHHHGFDCKTDSYSILPDGRLDLAAKPTTVHMVAPIPAGRGYIEPQGDAEDLGDWLTALADYDVVSCECVLGWAPYSHLVRIRPQVDREEREDVWYLVPDEAMPIIRAKFEANLRVQLEKFRQCFLQAVEKSPQEEIPRTLDS